MLANELNSSPCEIPGDNPITVKYQDFNEINKKILVIQRAWKRTLSLISKSLAFSFIYDFSALVSLAISILDVFFSCNCLSNKHFKVQVDNEPPTFKLGAE